MTTDAKPIRTRARNLSETFTLPDGSSVAVFIPSAQGDDDEAIRRALREALKAMGGE